MIKYDYLPSRTLVIKEIASATKKDNITDRDIDLAQKELQELFYGSIQTICFANLGFEQDDEEKRKMLNKEHDYPQIPENPKISVICSSKDRFSKELSRCLEDCLIIQNPKEFLEGLGKDFYKYILRGGTSGTKLGEFYLDSGRVFFKTEHSLPPKSPPGDSTVVGGILLDKAL